MLFLSFLLQSISASHFTAKTLFQDLQMTKKSLHVKQTYKLRAPGYEACVNFIILDQ